MPKGRFFGVLAVAAALALARVSLHFATHSLPVSNDDAIPLLMARHILKGEHATILWNQPYNGTLDAYLLAGLLTLASAHTAFRVYEAVCGLALVLLAGLLARRAAGEAAGWAAAVLAAIGSPYMALMAATGPTPNFLVPLLVGLCLLLMGSASGGRAIGRLLAGSLLGGLAIWDSALAVPALAGSALGLLLAGRRPPFRKMALIACGLMAGASPLLVARAIGASGSSPVTDLRPRWLWSAGIAGLGRAAIGLFGLRVPLVVDGPERAALPLLAAIALAAGLLLLVLVAARSRDSLWLLGWGGGLAAAFALSRRTGGDEVRYLFGLVLPVLALAGAGLARLWRVGPAVATGAALSIVVPWLIGHHLLLRAWREPQHASHVWQVPPLDPVVGTLRRAGVRSAYASLQIAGRLALESDEQVLTSQAWNERIPGDPLRFRDEVDLDPKAAWVLSPGLSRGMPRAQRFRELLAALGGDAHEDLPGELAIFRAFHPPYDEDRPIPEAALHLATLDGVALPSAVLDRDPETRWTADAGIARAAGLAIRVDPPRRVSALVLLVDLEASPLAVPWVAEVDGALAARGPAPYGLQWVNGCLRAGKQAVLALTLPERQASEMRLVFQGPGPPLALAEVFVYGPDEPPRPSAGEAAAAAGLERARRGDWTGAVAAYAEAIRLEPHRASFHSCWARSRWRAVHRRLLDVESLDDGGAALVVPGPRPGAD
jgi:hypothetical protein